MRLSVSIGLLRLALLAILSAVPVIVISQLSAEEHFSSDRVRERPIMRTLSRGDLYAKLGADLGMGKEEVKPVVVSLEDRGFLLRDAITLILLAKIRADRMTQEGKVTNETSARALRESVDYLVGVIDKEGAGWQALAQKARADLDSRAVLMKAALFMGLSSKTVPASGDPKAKGQATAARPREAIRQRDPVAERNLPREAIYNNLVKELGLELETVKSLLTRLTSEMPVREGVILLLVAKALTDKRLERGEFSRGPRKEAFSSSVDAVMPLVQKGEGWGDVGKKVGVDLPGVYLNKKANALIGQR